MAKQTFKYGDKEVPATKNGLPNCVYLTKAEREVVKAFAEQQKKGKTDTSLKQLSDSLNNLK
jgi:hypothetical protein